MKIITDKQVLVNGKKYSSSADGEIGVEPKPAPLPAGWSVINPTATKPNATATSSKPKKDGTKALQFAKDTSLLEIGQEKLKQLLGLEQKKKTSSAPSSTSSQAPSPKDEEKKNNTGKILLVVGGLALVGTLVYFATRKKGK